MGLRFMMLSSLADFGDLVRHQAVGLAVNVDGGLFVRRLDQAEHPPVPSSNQ